MKSLFVAMFKAIKKEITALPLNCIIDEKMEDQRAKTA